MTNCRLVVISSGARKILLDLQVPYRREDLISRADSELDLILFNVSGYELAGSRRGNGGESDEFILGIEFDSSTGLGTGPNGNLSIYRSVWEGLPKINFPILLKPSSS